jgi:hypothetical protein
MRSVPGAVLCACASIMTVAFISWATAATSTTSSPVASHVAAPRNWGLLEKYCFECHNIRKMRTGMMPPPGEPRPERARLDALAQELESRLDKAGHAQPHPGAKSLHRLNRTEYENAIRDLLAYELDVSTLLPADDAAEGFDNIADVLGVSPTLIQSYVSAAMKISRLAVGDPSMAPVLVKYMAPGGAAQRDHIEGLPLGTRGGVRFTHNFPLDAEYEFRVAAGSGFRFAGPDGGPPPKIDVTLNGAPVQVEDPRKFRLRVKAGPQTLTVALIEQRRSDGVDELYAKSQPRRDDVESITIQGPIEATGAGDTPSRRAVFVCQPEGSDAESPCARRILTRLASRAFRRPLASSDPAVDRLMQFYEDGHRQGGFETGIQHGLARILADPRFLYRMESEPADTAPGSVYRISDLDLASRLSFFIWSSIPDDELLEVASAGKLSDARVLEREVRRMLADPRSKALVENFAGQWLHLRELRNAEPLDRDFDDNLRQSFRQETELLFSSIVNENRSIVDLLDTDHTFLNERLARHYGIPGVRGSYMRRVELPEDSPRRGLLGQGSILTVTSVGNRTSPVIRGAWVLENLLGAPAPRPPPGVEADLKEDADASKPTSVRERLERHRANPTCASCHQIMDPIGFSLENFDLIGRWRDTDGGMPVNSKDRLVDGTPVNGVNDLRHALLARSDAFVTSASEKLLTYALGRRLEHFDQPAVREIVRDARDDDYRFASLVLGVVNSVPFQMKVKNSQ